MLTLSQRNDGRSSMVPDARSSWNVSIAPHKGVIPGPVSCVLTGDDQIATTTPAGELILTVFAGVATLGRKLIKRRQRRVQRTRQVTIR